MQERHELTLDDRGRLYLPKDTIDRFIGSDDLQFHAVHQRLGDLDFLMICNTKAYAKMERALIRDADEMNEDPAGNLRFLMHNEAACRGLDDKGYYIRISREPVVFYMTFGPKPEITRTEDLFTLFSLPKGGPVTVIGECDKLFVVKRGEEQQYEEMRRSA